jgi:prepilin-type N-terminal cleavage/methylation domain-containing protein
MGNAASGKGNEAGASGMQDLNNFCGHLRTKCIETSDERSGFTLIELLVVVAIIAVLAGLLLPALAKAKYKAAQINEVNGAKQLMLAWQMYAQDHRDHVLPGHRYGFEARDMNGRPIEFEVLRARYPWRIAPYLGQNFMVMYLNENRRTLETIQRMADTNLMVYAASVFPSLGANSVFVGGDDQEFPPSERAFAQFGRFCVLQMSEIRRPSQLMAFVSARGPFDGKIVPGFHVVRPPFLQARRWAVEWNDEDGPEAWGHVHPRYGRRGVAGMTDGHVESVDRGQLQDMQRWANLADRPDWVMRPTR